MNRTALIIAAIIVVVGIAVTFWIVLGPADTPEPTAPTTTAPQQFDTTGGQEKRPRWGAQEEQGNDAAGD